MDKQQLWIQCVSATPATKVNYTNVS